MLKNIPEEVGGGGIKIRFKFEYVMLVKMKRLFVFFFNVWLFSFFFFFGHHFLRVYFQMLPLEISRFGKENLR